MTAPRLMLEPGATIPHNEMRACATYHCVPVAAPPDAEDCHICHHHPVMAVLCSRCGRACRRCQAARLRTAAQAVVDAWPASDMPYYGRQFRDALATLAAVLREP